MSTSSIYTNSFHPKNLPLVAAFVALLSFLLPALAVHDSMDNPHQVKWYLQYSSWVVMLAWLTTAVARLSAPARFALQGWVAWITFALSFIFLLHQTYWCIAAPAIAPQVGFWLLWMATLLLAYTLLAKRQAYAA